MNTTIAGGHKHLKHDRRWILINVYIFSINYADHISDSKLAQGHKQLEVPLDNFDFQIRLGVFIIVPIE